MNLANPKFQAQPVSEDHLKQTLSSLDKSVKVLN
jgi:hypothetical protein